MNVLDEARELLDGGHRVQALELLHEAVEGAGDDPVVLEQVHELAAHAHDDAVGLDRVEWQRLLIESEPR